jgi:NADH-quinone oxidoreductase subunit L
MLILVLGDNLVLLFVGWEGVGLCSYLLIGFWYNKDGPTEPGDANATAGRKAFIVNRIGDFAFVLGMFVLFYFGRTLNIEELAGRVGALTTTWDAFGITTVSVAGAAAILLFIGATGKSAQIPLYVWLPDAMAGPTPVSALIHAATMVTAGVYMVARLNFIYMLSPVAMGVVALVGAATALFAATIGFAQNDIKKVLAYSTVSQLGYMFMAVGVGAYAAGIFHLFTHAFFKACLFLCAGSVIHAMSGDQDIRRMGGLAKKTPITHWTFLVSTLAISGILPFAGFFSKDEILWKTISTANPAWPTWFPTFVWVLGTLAALCTAFYMFRLYFLTFSGQSRADEETKHHIHESPWAMTSPLVVLAIGAAVLGFLGLPGVLGEHVNLFHNWLAPVVDRGKDIAAGIAAAGDAPIYVKEGPLAASHATEWALMALSLAIAIVGIAIAWRLYKGGYSAKVEAFVGGIPRLHRVVLNKYFVDELYHTIIVRPLTWLANVFARAVDAFFIDFIGVNGSAKVVDWSGQILRWVQSGNVQRYVVGLVVGAAVLGFWMAVPNADFAVKPGRRVKPGQPVQFEAELKSRGPRQIEYRWDFDGDGEWDAEWSRSDTASHTYDKKESYKVRLQIRDARWPGRTHTESKTVQVMDRPQAGPGAEREAEPGKEVR